MRFCPYLRQPHKSPERSSTVTWHTILSCGYFLLKTDDFIHFSFSSLNKKKKKKKTLLTSFWIEVAEIAWAVKQWTQMAFVVNLAADAVIVAVNVVMVDFWGLGRQKEEN